MLCLPWLLGRQGTAEQEALVCSIFLFPTLSFAAAILPRSVMWQQCKVPAARPDPGISDSTGNNFPLHKPSACPVWQCQVSHQRAVLALSRQRTAPSLRFCPGLASSKHRGAVPAAGKGGARCELRLGLAGEGQCSPLLTGWFPLQLGIHRDSLVSLWLQ